MTNFIAKINTYYNEKGIEIQEKEIISGQLPLKEGHKEYTAMVDIQVNVGEQTYPQPISVTFVSNNIESAFKESDELLKKQIEKFQRETEEAIKKAKDDAPRIIH